VEHKLRVQYWPIDKVKPYPNNPRNNDKAVEYVANSIREFSFQQPLVVDNDGIIIAGHTRLLAAKELGLKEVPVIVADDLTPEQAKAYRLADNKTGELAGWDFEQLDIELGDIADIDMSSFGFEAFAKTLESPSGGGGGEVDLDEFEDGNFEHVCPKCGFHFNDKK